MPSLVLQGLKLGKVYCTSCTRNVDADVITQASVNSRLRLRAVFGQKCPRCASSLDAAFVVGQ